MPPTWFVLTAAGLAGLAFLLMEMVWYRMLGPILGGTTFTFGLILAVALLGIGLGGTGYALWGQQRPPTLRGFAVLCLLESLFVIAPYAFGDRIALLALLLRPLAALGFASCVFGCVPGDVRRHPAGGVCRGLAVPGADRAARTRQAECRATRRSGVCMEHRGLHRWLTGRGIRIAAAAVGPRSLAAVRGPLVRARGRRGSPFLLSGRAAGGRLGAGGQAGAGIRAGNRHRHGGPFTDRGADRGIGRHSGIGAGRAQVQSLADNPLHNYVNERRRAIVWEKDGIESSVAALQSTRPAWRLS